MKNKVIYVVLGMHRSGTSLVAKMLQTSGISLGNNLIGPSEDNPKGFWEDAEIVALNENILSELGIDWDSLHGFFLGIDNFNTKAFQTFKAEAKALVRDRLSSANAFCFKDPRTSRLLPFWQLVFDELGVSARYIFTFRHPKEVQLSLEKRNGFLRTKSAWLWFFYSLDALLHLSQQSEWIEFDYESVLVNPSKGVQKLCSAFDIDIAMLDEVALSEFCDEFVDAKLRNHIHTGEGGGDSVATLYELLDQLNSERISRDEFQRAIRVISESFDSDSPIIELTNYAGKLEQTSKQKVIQLEAEKSTQFKDYHQEEKRLVGIIDQLTETASENAPLHEQLAHSIAQADQLNSQLEENRNTINNLGEKQRETKDQLLQTEVKCSDFESTIVDLKEKLKSATIESKTIIDNQNAELASARASLSTQKATLEAEFDTEKKRLWDIVEKYRIRSEENLTLATKLKKRIRHGAAKFLKIENGGHKSLIFMFRHRLKLMLKSLIYRLPEDSQARHRIMQFLIRVRSVLHGDVDGKNLRKSHEYSIQHRQSEPVVIKSMADSDLPLIDVSVVSHNSAKYIDSFIKSLLSQRYPLEKICLTIVDNNSTDATLDIWEGYRKSLTAQLSGFKLINSQNVGFGEGHNTAFGQSACEFVLVSNLDLEFTSDTIFNAVTYAISDDYSVASWECRQQPFEHPKFYDPVSLDTSWSSHACILIRRSCFDQVGGYEKRIFMYGEDVELSYRFRAHGFRIKYLPKSVVFHYTYDEVEQVKPLQFAGSTLANSYIRLRYGSKWEVLSIPKMYLSLLWADTGIPGARRAIFKNIRSLLFNTPYFLSTRKRTHPGFSFRHWDYGIIRDGSFYQSPSSECCLQKGERPLVSVITRTFKGREYWLKEALMSIVNQTHAAIEIVVVEDGGDTMRPLVEDFQYKHKHVSFVYKSLPKRGRCYAGNQGLALARGDYLMFLDDDDLLFCDHIETSLCELENDSSLSAVYALSWDVETRLKGEVIEQGYVEMSHSTSDILRQAYDKEVLQHHNYISIQSILFKRALYEQHGGFDEELDNLEDWNLWVRFSSNAIFKLITKTTSMFRTPWSVVEKAKRQKALDAYYKKTLEKNHLYLLSQHQKGS